MRATAVPVVTGAVRIPRMRGPHPGHTDRSAEYAQAVVADNLLLERQLCVALHRATRAVLSCYRPGLRALGLTYSQYMVMLVLWQQGETTQRELVALLGLDSGTLSPVLKRLEQRGLVRRTRQRDDERVLGVSLTEAGHQLSEQAASVQRSVEEATGLTQVALARLRRQLDLVATRCWTASDNLGAPDPA